MGYGSMGERVPKTKGSRYRLLHQLGKGGMASVWAADDLSQGGRVAIKFLSPEYVASEKQRERFENEAWALQQIRSVNVVRVYEHELSSDEEPYIVMELLEGEDLRCRLEREARLGTEDASALLEQIANGLDQAHEAGIVHRDLKPGNIFIAHNGSDECVKIVDFGIAKMTHEGSRPEVTATGAVLGTINYMSPEQLRDSKDVDHRSDLWSLGVIAFRVLTGVPPFPGENAIEVITKISAGLIPSVFDVAPDLGMPSSMDAFFARALARDREQRFLTARELVDEFKRAAQGLPLSDPQRTIVLEPEAVAAPHRATLERVSTVVEQPIPQPRKGSPPSQAQSPQVMQPMTSPAAAFGSRLTSILVSGIAVTALGIAISVAVRDRGAAPYVANGPSTQPAAVVAAPRATGDTLPLALSAPQSVSAEAPTPETRAAPPPARPVQSVPPRRNAPSNDLKDLAAKAPATVTVPAKPPSVPSGNQSATKAPVPTQAPSGAQFQPYD